MQFPYTRQILANAGMLCVREVRFARNRIDTTGDELALSALDELQLATGRYSILSVIGEARRDRSAFGHSVGIDGVLPTLFDPSMGLATFKAMPLLVEAMYRLLGFYDGTVDVLHLVLRSFLPR